MKIMKCRNCGLLMADKQEAIKYQCLCWKCRLESRIEERRREREFEKMKKQQSGNDNVEE